MYAMVKKSKDENGETAAVGLGGECRELNGKSCVMNVALLHTDT